MMILIKKFINNSNNCQYFQLLKINIKKKKIRKLIKIKIFIKNFQNLIKDNLNEKLYIQKLLIIYINF